MSSVGIIGLGFHLPELVRTNDWWPDRVVAEWQQTAIDNRKRVEAALAGATTEGEKRVLAAMLETRADPFRGVQQRHVMPPGMHSSDMETEAARMAIQRAGIDPKDIEFILTASVIPDFLTIPNAFILHEKLGLPERCIPMTAESACNGFLLQLTIAEQMILSGRARIGLIVQSCGISRVLPSSDPQSAWFGDGAAAQVVAQVDGKFGILGRITRTDSTLRRAVMVGVPEKDWYDGASVLYSSDRSAAYRILLGFGDQGKQAVESSLADAHLSASDVDFFACHQAQIWQRRVVQDFAGLNHARTLDTFAHAANVGPANVPLVLAMAEREGLLRSGDLVSMFGGGAGITWTGMVARWGAA